MTKPLDWEHRKFEFYAKGARQETTGIFVKGRLPINQPVAYDSDIEHGRSLVRSLIHDTLKRDRQHG